MLPPDYLLQNRYRIAHQLGSGGFATVYLAYDTRLGNRPVAIKALNLAALAPADQQWVVEAFQQEALVLAELTHPGIAAILDFFITEQTQYLVMEHVAGETLADAINRIPGGRYHEVQVLSWARQLCDVLHYLHTHQPPIIFRDLKPQNIMVQPDGQLKMIDFGIARYFKPGQKRDTMAVGTPGYSAPEQHGQGQTDARSDIYALGVLLHQLLTGIDPAIKPFFFLPVRQVAPDITPHIADAVATALAHQPKDRFATVREFEQALLKPPSTLTTTIPLGPASGSFKWFGVAFALVILLGGGFFVSRGFINNDVTPTPLPTGTSQVVIVTATVPTATLTPIPPSPTLTPTQPTPTPTLTPTITNTPPPTPFAGAAGWIALSARIDGDFEIIKYNLQTGQVIQLTFNDHQDYHPVWSPDGRKIAFHALIDGARQYDIFIMNADGSELYNLTNHADDDAFPSWAPEGDQLVFHSNRSGDFEIFLIDINGFTATQLTYNNVDDNTAAWSPDGRQIAFSSRRGADRQIVVIDRDGRNEQVLTSDEGNHWYPHWSPDSSQLVFYLDKDGSTDLYVINRDGSGLMPVARTTTGEFYPRWSPDGQWILYHQENEGSRDIYRIRPDGSEQTVILENEMDERQPDWQPLP